MGGGVGGGVGWFEPAGQPRAFKHLYTCPAQQDSQIAMQMFGQAASAATKTPRTSVVGGCGALPSLLPPPPLSFHSPPVLVLLPCQQNKARVGAAARADNCMPGQILRFVQSRFREPGHKTEGRAEGSSTRERMEGGREGGGRAAVPTRYRFTYTDPLNNQPPSTESASCRAFF